MSELIYAKLKKVGCQGKYQVIVHTEEKLKLYKRLGYNVIKEVRQIK